MDKLRRLFSWSGGLGFGKPEPQKEELKTNHWRATKRKAWTSTSTPSKRHMMPLGLVPGFQTQALGWRHQGTHWCANQVATKAVLWVCDRTRTFFPHIYGLNIVPINGYYSIHKLQFGFPFLNDKGEITHQHKHSSTMIFLSALLQPYRVCVFFSGCTRSIQSGPRDRERKEAVAPRSSSPRKRRQRIAQHSSLSHFSFSPATAFQHLLLLLPHSVLPIGSGSILSSSSLRKRRQIIVWRSSPWRLFPHPPPCSTLSPLLCVPSGSSVDCCVCVFCSLIRIVCGSLTSL